MHPVQGYSGAGGVLWQKWLVLQEEDVHMSRIALRSKLRPSGVSQDLPLFLETVAAGFPSPAGDYIECRLDLNEHLIQHPSATFFVRVAGDSMIGAGIHDKDLLIVDRSLEPKSGHVVVAAVNGELTVKRLLRHNGRCMLQPENEAFESVDIPDGADVHIWGVATSVIHKL